MAAGEKVIPEITVGNQTYKLMDETAREHLVEVKSTTPTSEDNRLWIKEMSAAEEEANTYEVPTINEFNDLKSAFDDALFDGNIYKAAEFALGFVKKSDGTIYEGGVLYKYSRLIPVEAGEQFEYKLSGSASVLLIAAYASSSASATVAKSIIGSNADYIEDVYTVPDGISFIRVSNNIDVNPNAILKKIDEAKELGKKFALSDTFVDGYNFASKNNPDFIEGHYITKDGTITKGYLYNVTGFIPVEEGDQFFVSTTALDVVTPRTMRFVCAYDSSKNPISASGSDSEISMYTVPSGVSYIRISVSASLWDSNLQIEKGFKQTTYEEPTKYYSPLKIADETINYKSLKDYRVTDGFNYALTGKTGTGLWYKSGDYLQYIEATGSYANYAYVICPCEENTTYYLNTIGRWIHTIDKHGNIVLSINNSSNRIYFDSGANAVTMIVVYDVTLQPGQLVISTYRPEDGAYPELRYTADWLQTDFVDRTIKGKALASRIYCSLPSVFYCDSSKSTKIYLRNILAQEGTHFWCNSPTGLTTFLNNEYLEVSANSGSYTLNWEIFDTNLQSIETGTTTFVFSDITTLENATGLLIGDSFFAYDQFSSRMITAFSDHSASLTLLGTRGTSPNFHEGRGGWSAEKYCTLASEGDYTNPFLHNGTFDFSYYMSSQEYSGVDFVVINLGINAVFDYRFYNYSYPHEHEIDSYKKIIDSIHSYDSSIKIYCNLPTPPNTADGAFSQRYGTKTILFMYENLIKHYAYDMVHEISGENVYIVGTNAVINTDTEINDGVHPKAAGCDILTEAIVDAIGATQ